MDLVPEYLFFRFRINTVILSYSDNSGVTTLSPVISTAFELCLCLLFAVCQQPVATHDHNTEKVICVKQ